MFDDLRKEASSIYESDEISNKPVEKASVSKVPQRQKTKKILGMTAPQRFAIVFMVMIMTCVTGFMLLLVMGKIGF